MGYRLLDYVCPECGRQDEYLVELDEEGLPVAPLCTCPTNCVLQRVYSPIRAVFGHGFFSHDRPRRIEVEIVGEDGSKRRMDLTNKIDTNGAPGAFMPGADLSSEKF
jgi:hypothetical protein